jgi:hypothetical protein
MLCQFSIAVRIRDEKIQIRDQERKNPDQRSGMNTPDQQYCLKQRVSNPEREG